MLTYKNLSLKQIQTLATELAKQFRNRDVAIGFIGTLGSGKTTFIKAFAKTLGIKHITSPTFVIAHEYPIAKGKLYHLDFYRLKRSKDLIILDLPQMFTRHNVVLAEWIDRFPKVAKQCDLLIRLNVKPNNKRDVIIKAKK